MTNQEKEEKVTVLLEIISGLFSSIRNDWNDPRWECRSGQEGVSHLRELLSIPGERYRSLKTERLMNSLKSIVRSSTESEDAMNAHYINELLQPLKEIEGLFSRLALQEKLIQEQADLITLLKAQLQAKEEGDLCI